MLWVKAVHVMAIISWMAGLLYVYRLFVYHAMETEKVVQERFQVMERRLIRGIMHPAAVLALGTGIALLTYFPVYLHLPWMHAKLTFVAGLFVSHAMAMRFRVKLIAAPNSVPHKTFRFLNEVPTLLMVGIVIMIIVRPWS